MGQEIERKFLLRSDGWRRGAVGEHYRQGYLSTDATCTVRLRVAGERARLTVKGRAQGLTRPEYEYDVPLADAEAMLESLCRRPLIDKTRYRVRVGAHTWEIDEFHAENAGLVLAELELSREDEPFERPDWLGDEVTQDTRYTNARLVERPYATWSSLEEAP